MKDFYEESRNKCEWNYTPIHVNNETIENMFLIAEKLGYDNTSGWCCEGLPSLPTVECYGGNMVLFATDEQLKEFRTLSADVRLGHESGVNGTFDIFKSDVEMAITTTGKVVDFWR